MSKKSETNKMIEEEYKDKEELREKNSTENKEKSRTKRMSFGEKMLEKMKGAQNKLEEQKKQEINKNNKIDKIDGKGRLLSMIEESKKKNDLDKQKIQKDDNMYIDKIEFDNTKINERYIKMKEDNKKEEEQHKKKFMKEDNMSNLPNKEYNKNNINQRMNQIEVNIKEINEKNKEKAKKNDEMSNMKKIEYSGSLPTEKLAQMKEDLKINENLRRNNIITNDNMIKEKNINPEKIDVNKKVNEMNDENNKKNEITKKNMIKNDVMPNMDNIKLEKFDANKKINEMDKQNNAIFEIAKQKGIKNDGMLNIENIQFEKIDDKVNEIDAQILKNELESQPVVYELPKPEIIPKPEDLLEQNENFSLYKYPEIRFSALENRNCKTILMLGNAQEDMINLYINIFANISFNDNIRYTINKIDTTNINIYDIYSCIPEKSYNIKIISIPQINEIDDSFKNNIIKLFKEQIPRNKIHLVCFTFKENKIELNIKEKVFYRFIINLFDLKEKVFFLISSNGFNENNNNKYSIHEFLNYDHSEYIYKGNNQFNPNYFSINNKFIFEKDENNWKKMEENIQIIKNKLVISGTELTSDRKDLMELIFFKDKDNIIPKFSIYPIREKNIIFYFLIDMKNNLGEDSSDLLLKLFNNTYKNENNTLHKGDEKLELFQENNLGNTLYILSELTFYFDNLQHVIITQCEMDDETILLEKILSSRINTLILNNNKIKDLGLFNKRQIYNNLTKLDLSFNNIENISAFMNCTFNSLRFLYLNNNKISNIGCFGSNNFGSLECLNLLDNEIKSGIEKFTLSFENTSSGLTLELIQEKQHKILFFKYSLSLNIDFKYIIEEQDTNDLLKNISFKGIKYLTLKGFDNNIFFLSNNTLNSLKEINFIENNITDLSIFDNIKFIGLEKLNIDYNSSSFYKFIEKGFRSLNYFSRISVEKLEVNYKNNKYESKVSFLNPELNIYFTNADFLFDNLLSNVKKLIIPNSLFDIDANNNSLFSYETLKNRKLPFYRKIYSHKIKINYNKQNNLYESYIEFLSPELNITFNFNSISFLDDINMYKNIREINLCNLSNESLSNINFDNYNCLKLIKLKNSYIKNIEIISRLYNKKIICDNIECSPDLIEPLENYYFDKVILGKRLKYVYKDFYENLDNKIKYAFPYLAEILEKYPYIKDKYDFLYYDKPFCFEIQINEDIIKNIHSLKNCVSINLSDGLLKINDFEILQKDCFSSITHLNLSNSHLKNMNFVTYNSLSNLKHLILNNNQIEDIHPLNEENFKCKNLNLLKLQKNPIRKSLQSLKQKLFVYNCLYITINDIIKKNEEFYVSLIFNNPLSYIDLKCGKNEIKGLIEYNNDLDKEKRESLFIYIDFYIEDLNNLWNFLDYEYTFFDLYIDYYKLQKYNFNISEKEFTEKAKINEYYSLLLDNRRENYIYTLTLGNDDEIIKKVFKLAYDKGYNYLIELSEIDLFLCFEKVKFYYSFLNSESLVNYNFENLSSLEHIDLSKIETNDIAALYGDVPFVNLKSLNLSNHYGETNLNELKHAKFINLEELFLANCEIYSLTEIEMDKYPFDNLRVLDLNHNHISDIIPILHFKHLKELNLEYNEIETKDALTIKDNINLRIFKVMGNNVEGPSIGIMYM